MLEGSQVQQGKPDVAADLPVLLQPTNTPFLHSTIFVFEMVSEWLEGG